MGVRHLLVPALIAVWLPSVAGAAPAVRFAACGTCTAQGVEGLILKQTNIGELVGLDIGVSFFSPPQMGAGIASNSLDVEFVGAQPVLAQLANGIPIKIAAFMYDFELRMEALSSTKSVVELKDKRIGVPFGTTAYQFASEIMVHNGIPKGALANVAPADLATALSGGQIAAAVIWDPVWGVLEKSQKTVALERKQHAGFTAMRKQFVEQSRDSAARFLAAQMLAVAFRANNVDETDKRYASAFGVPVEIVKEAQEIDRARGWKTLDQVDLSIQPKDRAELQDTMAFVLKEKLIPQAVDVEAAIDQALVKDATKFLADQKISLSQVHYVNDAK
jgi:ABC-type nitrate/sulfonate/bicarbonate transport system substrate-binding protein